MIVVDTNTIAYLYLPSAHTPDVEQLLAVEADWAAPRLWRSEFRNILALYVRRKILALETACQIQEQAELLMADGEYEIDSLAVLGLTKASGCSAYDCEFVALAQGLDKILLTFDKKVLKGFPGLAMSAGQYVQSLR